MPRNECSNLLCFLEPAGRAQDHILASPGAGFDMGENTMWRGKVDDNIDGIQLFRNEECAVCILFGIGGTHMMSAFRGNFCDERSGFASAQDEEIHCAFLMRFNHREHRGAQGCRIVVVPIVTGDCPRR